MKNLELKIVHDSGRTGSSRLCASCAYGMLIRGEGMEFAWCAYIRDYISVRVEECNRYVASDAPATEESIHLLARYTLD